MSDQPGGRPSSGFFRRPRGHSHLARTSDVRDEAGRDVNNFALEYQENFSGHGSMQGFASIFLSLMAIGLSVVTTYLSFFDERYTLSASLAKVSSQTQTSSSRSGDAPPDVLYRTFVNTTLIVSNRGSRPLVLSGIRARKSTDLASCVFETPRAPASRFAAEFKPLIIEPGTVRDLKYNFSTGDMTNDFETRAELWCLKFVIFDHRGERLEPAMRTVNVDYELVPQPAKDKPVVPKLEVKISYPREPMILAQSGWFAKFGGE